VISDRQPIAEPIAVRVPDAARLIGLSRSRLYELMKRGEVEYVKVGGATLIPYEGLRAFIERQRRPEAASDT
jgi:excisionase family DNA binding protein